MNFFKHSLLRFTLVVASSFLLLWSFSAAGLAAEPTSQAPSSLNTELGYGFNVAAWDLDKLQGMGFNWIKVFNAPGDRLPVNVLLRVSGSAGDFADLTAYRNEIRSLAQNNGAYIDAYEIGNEVNLDASYGWGDKVPPVAADYVAVLCAAYDEIKQHDPDSIVISAGLAPTGRVTGNWEGHNGHNGLYQDDWEYLREMIDAGAGACMDAVGYHNYGFSADFDTPPNVNGGTPQSNCTNGFCFRGVESIHAIMQEYPSTAELKIWTTEYGWITDPADEGLADCKENDPGWQGRAWQIVTHQQQADNLAGSFAYAAENWPWMGGMIVFNLNFNEAGYYDDCEQMRFYSVAGRPAEGALRDLPKAYEFVAPELDISLSNGLGALITADQLPMSRTVDLVLRNAGGDVLTYTVEISAAADLVPIASGGGLNGQLAPDESVTVTLSYDAVSLTEGAYYGRVDVLVSPEQAGYPMRLDFSLHIVPEIKPLFLPIATRP